MWSIHYTREFTVTPEMLKHLKSHVDRKLWFLRAGVVKTNRHILTNRNAEFDVYLKTILHPLFLSIVCVCMCIYIYICIEFSLAFLDCTSLSGNKSQREELDSILFIFEVSFIFSCFSFLLVLSHLLVFSRRALLLKCCQPYRLMYMSILSLSPSLCCLKVPYELIFFKPWLQRSESCTFMSL